MSHFTVAVFTSPGQSVDDLLAPFHEFECTGIDDQYVQDVDTTAEFMNNYENYKLAKVKDPSGKIIERDDPVLYRELTKEEEEDVAKNKFFSRVMPMDINGIRKTWYLPEGYTEIEVPAKEVMTPVEFLSYYNGINAENCLSTDEIPDLEERHKYSYARLDGAGNVIKLIRRTNPNKKWDWYVIGGRWHNMLTDNNGNECNSCLVSDLNIIKMADDVRKERIAVWKEFEKSDCPAEHNRMIFGIPEGINSLEEYLALPVVPISTYAVITPDGEWHAPGEMGWFGCSSASKDDSQTFEDTYSEKFLIPARNNGWSITIVDCHI